MIGTNTAVQRWVAGSLLCGAFGVSACAPARPAVIPVSQTRVVTSEVPPYTPIELQLAQEELRSARLAWDSRDYDQARRLAEQAVADARIAEVRATAESTRQTARDLRLSSESLRDDAARLSTVVVTLPPASSYLPPSSPIELQSAQEALDRARLAWNTRDYDQAHRLAEQAATDAQVAELRAATETSRRIARSLRLSSEALRDEAARFSIATAYVPAYPPVELRWAQDELDRARLAVEVRDYGRARRLADQALVDAQLAEVRATTQSSRQAARDLRLSIETLRADAARLAALY